MSGEGKSLAISSSQGLQSPALQTAQDTPQHLLVLTP